MIQDIAPRRFDGTYHECIPCSEDFLLLIDDDRILVKTNSAGEYIFGSVADYSALTPLPESSLQDCRYLFSVDEDRYFLCGPECSKALISLVQSEAETSFCWENIFQLRTIEPSWMGFVGITALQLSRWYQGNRFCGTCGAALQHGADERVLTCPSCDELLYPKISPAIIAAVVDGNKLLLTRYASGPYSRYALVAGFVEVGETLEETVKREVFEETGIRVKNIRYYKSQPWGLSSSLLAGFFCELEGDPHITIDKKELSEALWVERSDVTPPESMISLTAEMIELFRTQSSDLT